MKKMIEENRTDFQQLLDSHLSLVTKQVIEKDEFSIRFNNPDIKQCHQVRKCGKRECPCYGADAVRCWHITGTSCSLKNHCIPAKRLAACAGCIVLKEATLNPAYMTAEQFNNVLHILELKSIELDKAYEELSKIQMKALRQAKMASIGQLAAGIAHEINNPMGFISSNLETDSEGCIVLPDISTNELNEIVVEVEREYR